MATQAVQVRSLAEFKRFLALPGATVTTLRNDGFEATAKMMNRPPDEAASRRASFFGPRTVKVLHRTDAQLSNGSWLQFETADKYRFEGDTVTVDLGGRPGTPPFEHVLVYQLTQETEG